MNKEINKSPAFQFYPDKWQSHTRRLSDSAYRIYFEMLCWMWQHSEDHCSISNNAEAIACKLALPCDRIANALLEIQNPHAPLLREHSGMLISNGLRKEASKQKERRYKCSTVAKSRWTNEKQSMRTHSERNANASFTQCSPSPTPIPSPSPASHEREGAVNINPPTLTQCIEASSTIGMPQEEVQAFHAYYDSQGWKKSNGQAVTNLRSALQNWKIRQQTHAKQNNQERPKATIS